ncbi:MAG TPA: AraC family transcriptional regulator [Dongiaceae bacterium]|nr:AraC family transcriptional regulator [Dongiaceae bacterium]
MPRGHSLYVVPRIETFDLSRRSGSPPAVRIASRSGLAWELRGRLLSLDRREGAARRLVALALEHDHRPTPVAEAARALALSLRQLHRLAIVELGCTPGVLLGLARIASVARDVESGVRPLACIAREHGFIDRAAMHHQFMRFTGIAPGVYRAGARIAASPSRSDWQEFATTPH